MGIISTFIIFAITFVLRIVFGTLVDQFDWASKVVFYFNYGCIGTAALFVLFVILTVIFKFKGRK